MTITIRKDDQGYLASVRGQPHIFAWGETKAEAKKELKCVIEMLMDYHLEQIDIERRLKAQLAAA